MLKDLPFVVGDINAGRRCSREIETSGASERSRVLFLDFFRDRVVRLGVIETDVRWERIDRMVIQNTEFVV